jgi:uncharacterized membrane protein YebE (DUF533 family)
MAEEKNPFMNPKTLIEGDFFKEAGLDGLPQEEKEKIMTKLIESVRNRVLIRIDDLIDEKDRADFHKVLESGKDEDIRKYLEERKINVQQLVVEESLLQKAEMLNALAQIKK